MTGNGGGGVCVCERERREREKVGKMNEVLVIQLLSPDFLLKMSFKYL